jgi:UDP-2,4-diacetamido-2,4,6-trideoxy-beta-L-altropyranose hydrolase
MQGRAVASPERIYPREVLVTRLVQGGLLMVRILYRADGSAEIGTGHLLRGTLLARALAAGGAPTGPSTSAPQLTFLTRAHPWAIVRIEQVGLPYQALPVDVTPESEIEALQAASRALRPDLAVVDLLDTGTAPDLCAALRATGVPVLTFDNTGPGRLTADEVINFLVRDPDPAELAERGVSLHEGPEYATLLPEYEGVNRIPKRIAPHARQLLISVGGGDAAGLSLKAVHALAALPDPPEATVVVGSAFPHADELARLVEVSPARVTVRRDLPSLLPELQRADMAVVAGGLTMHEALATGTPPLALCQEVWHQQFLAGWFAERGAMVDLGRGDIAEEAVVASAIAALAADPERRAAMSRAGQALVDGAGTRRVAARMRELASVVDSRQSRGYNVE